ncbi:MAG: NADPH-dependent glutamate synthase [Deltaproteobacteria bacterium]
MTEQMRKQPAHERTGNFSEVALGLDARQAFREAERCLQCTKAPCRAGCPVEIDIPAFIYLIKQGHADEALKKIKEKNYLPAVCGRVCPQEDQCEAACVLAHKGMPINIGALERYAADAGKETRVRVADFHPPEAKRVAVVGSGPAGLTAAAELARRGYRVTLFESLHVAGGVLTYGIPEFRLPKGIVEQEVEGIRLLGVDIKVNFLVGRTEGVADLLKQGYKAVFIAAGAGLPNFMGIEGEDLAGVYSANEFLTRVNLMRAYRFPEYATPVRTGRRVVVVGGGNVALDSARCARRLGADVTLVYRRTEKEMPARLEEVANAREEGIDLQLLTLPKKVLGDEKGRVRGAVCARMRLGAPDASGRPRPEEIPGETFEIACDTWIVAIGQSPNPLLSRSTQGLATTDKGTIVVDEHYRTSIQGVFAGGDIVTGADTVIAAMGAGKQAARAIDEYLRHK